ncbi:beta-galactosidase [Streptomyces longwoodensis]
MHFGTSWYPEQWPEERWSEDLRLMRESGMTVVRLGDFAWSRLEPEEGRFALDWLARAVDLASEHGLSCVLATPTAGPPVWLTERFPEVLLTGSDGRRAQHGNRAHASPTSSRYRMLCARIAEQLARRFGPHPAVIGWQIDNELNMVSYDDEETGRLFAAWLRRRYGTVAELNRRWGTVFWSQEYTDFAQVPVPVGVHHPSLQLAWRRFLTDAFRDFLGGQAEAVRKHARPGQFISHNVMTAQDDYDLAAFAADLDVVGYDFYSGHLDFPDLGGHHDLVRGLKRRPYWLMEAQPGAACWSGVNNALDRGEARRIAWSAVGHGADAVLYWQWRGSLGGQEQYHGTLLGPDGRPRPFHAEAVQVGRELAAAAPYLDDSAPAPEVALLQGHEDRWAIEGQRHHRDFDVTEYWMSLYRPLRRRGVDVDVVPPGTPLEDYRLVLAPGLHLLDEERAGQLTAWVRGGGRLLLGVRTGMKDTENVLLPARQPGPLAAFGVTVAEYYALDRPVPLTGRLLTAGSAAHGPGADGGAGAGAGASVWAEWLEVDEAAEAAGAEVLLRYGPSNGWLDGRPAVVTVPHGLGSVTYCGAWLDEPTTAALIDRLSDEARVHPPLPLPPDARDVELCRRVRPDGTDVLVVLNHGDQERVLPLPSARTDVLTGLRFEGTVTVAPNEVRVLAAP